jgi:hypothetical protein
MNFGTLKCVEEARFRFVEEKLPQLLRILERPSFEYVIYRDMNKTLLSLISLLLVVTGMQLQAQSAMVKIYNKTGQNIDSLTIGDKYIGLLARDNNTPFLNYPKFGFDAGYPDEKVTGKVHGKRVYDMNWNRHGSETPGATAGLYHFDLLLRSDGNNEYLQLDFHQN